MTENGNGNGNGNPWVDEPTPVETPVLDVNRALCQQLNELSATFTAVALEVSRLQRDVRRARTPFGPEILEALSLAFESGREKLTQTITKFQEWAIKASGGR